MILDVPAPTPTINPMQRSQPCENAEQSGQGLLSRIFNPLLSLFNSIFRSGNNSPCLGETRPSPSASGGSVHSAIKLVDHKIVQIAGRDMSMTVEKLNNVKQGDILVAMIGSDYAHVNSPPPGWKQIRQDVKNAGHIDDLALQSYYKFVTDSEPDNYTWNLITGRRDTPSDHQPLIAVDLYAFSGVSEDSPIFADSAHGETGDPKAIECPSVKGLTGGMLLCAYIGDDPGSITAPSSMEQTSNFVIGGGDVYGTAYELLESDADTGPRMAVWDNPENKNGSDFAHAIVLKPKE